MVQFLTYHGVRVTAVCKGEDSDLVRSLGATKIIDYTREDFLEDDEQYAVVFDTVAKSSFGACRQLLRPKGVFTTSEPNMPEVLTSYFHLGKKVKFRPPTRLKQRLAFINELLVKGRFAPVIYRTYPFENITDAFKYVLQGQKKGNVILSIGE